jgi:hypothetical protein
MYRQFYTVCCTVDGKEMEMGEGRIKERCEEE